MNVRDNRGRTVFVGDAVAYNISGQVAKGRVVRVNPRASGYHSTLIEVELLHRAAGRQPGHISKLRSALNVLVLVPQEEES